MATIRDVAQRAGVSTMTVSRVLNNSGYVSAEARTRVETAVAELGYVPNTLGLSLRFKRTQTLALVVTDITNPFFTSMARGVEDVASQRGFSTILCNTDESETKQADYLTILLQKRVDGILLVPARSAGAPGAVAAAAQCSGRDHRPPGARRPSRLRARPVGGGRTRPGGAPVRSRPPRRRHVDRPGLCLDRVRARRRIRCGRRRSGASSPRPGSIIYGHFTVPSGYADDAADPDVCVRGPLRSSRPTTSSPSAPTGRCATPGSRVPDDMSLVAFDNLPDHMVLDPFLTVAAQPAYEMGKRAAELLLDRLDGRGADEPQDIQLPNEIVVRRSSAPPPAFRLARHRLAYPLAAPQEV